MLRSPNGERIFIMSGTAEEEIVLRNLTTKISSAITELGFYAQHINDANDELIKLVHHELFSPPLPIVDPPLPGVRRALYRVAELIIRIADWDNCDHHGPR
jgi:hypothetical protein